ncbi:MAG: hypothetical protein D3904_12940 [Candidatus Electrothrix sp. EH2]|nr:hypothetical protein [Candidatus Electrothrix sp. EH2]
MKSRNDRERNVPESRERRTAMKKIAVGVGALAGISALPDKWTAPIVEGIVLPAHARTSAHLVICPDLTLTLLDGTQSSEAVAVRVQGCVTPATGGVRILLEVQGSLAAAVAAETSRQPEGLFEQVLSAAGDILVSEAMAAECTEIGGSALTDAEGDFSADFDIPCGPGIQSVQARAALAADRINGGVGYGILPLSEETEQPAASAAEPVDPPKKPVNACSVGIANPLEEDITLIHDETEYSIPGGTTFKSILTVYKEPFTLIFRAGPTEKVLARSGINALSLSFTDEVTVDDASCGDRYMIGIK